MAQPSVASYFNNRKRAAAEDLTGSRHKVLILDTNDVQSRLTEGALTLLSHACESPKIVPLAGNEGPVDSVHADESDLKAPVKRSRVITQLTFENVKVLSPTGPQTKRIVSRSKQSVRRVLIPDTQNGKEDITEKIPNMVPFIKKGNLSPKKRMTPTKEVGRKVASIFSNKSNVQNHVNNSSAKSSALDKMSVKTKDMVSLTEIKSKICRSSRLSELKASMAKINKGMAQLDQMENNRSGKSDVKMTGLKEFKSIELEVPASPQKVMASPQKTFLSPHKVSGNQLMSPNKIQITARKLILSPIKVQPTTPAYQRYQGLAEAGIPTLVLPYNYKCLAELFRCVDAVCAMLHNRNEIITFKKLKPAVQEMMRKNFTESHLAQIKTIYPDAFVFSQEKIRNFGSTSKQDKYEFVIVPNIQVNSEINPADTDKGSKSGQEKAMNPKVILARQRKFYNSMLEMIMAKHEEFLTTLDPPMSIPKHKLIRWHPEFDIEGIPDVEKSEIPQPPNIEVFSSAKDVLFKARNLFNCNTRMERALERLAEAKAKSKSVQNLINGTSNIDIKTEDIKIEPTEVKKSSSSQTESVESDIPVNSALKGIPKSLLEKIRAKQAAKALEAMTRSPGQDQEALKYGRLSEIARHTRNLFVTEKKGVLPLETVLKKLGNSYRANLTLTELEDHLKLLSKLLPGWVGFHDVRKAIFIKLSRDSDISKVQKKLESLASAKAK